MNAPRGQSKVNPLVSCKVKPKRKTNFSSENIDVARSQGGGGPSFPRSHHSQKPTHPTLILLPLLRRRHGVCLTRSPPLLSRAITSRARSASRVSAGPRCPHRPSLLNPKGANEDPTKRFGKILALVSPLSPCVTDSPRHLLRALATTSTHPPFPPRSAFKSII